MMNDAIRSVLNYGWPVRVTISGRPTTLDLKRAAAWATGPVDATACEVHANLKAVRS